MTHRTPRGAVPALLGAILLAGLFPNLACRRDPGADPDAKGAPNAADLRAIQRVREAYLKAYNDRDVDRLMELFTDDAVLVPEDDATCEGKKEVAGYYGDLLDQDPSTLKFEVRETQVLGEWAFERIDATLTGPDPDTGEEVETWERDFWILKRQPGGSWRITRAITNIEEPDDEDDPGNFAPKT